ncbi:hypothetical protein BLJ79_13340 [Arthrobacter sp. UCD-GKA]|nr:hypothetical protein BLJ79_13340 [Arthrobacter sp. UCD-GKA]
MIKGEKETGIDKDDLRNGTQNPGFGVLRECEWIGKVRAADSEGEPERRWHGRIPRLGHFRAGDAQHHV